MYLRRYKWYKMPRKKINPEDKKDSAIKKNKKNLINTMVKENDKDNDEHIILQLPLSQQRINNLINNDTTCTIDSTLPKPYESTSHFINKGETITNKNQKIINNEEEINSANYNRNGLCCYWCCHPIDHMIFGMPYNYDSINDTYLIYGSFCSLQCSNAYNFSIHCGSDKVWEINSWIQILGKRYGYENPIRPAPSRFLLKMFNGNLSIENFRKAHLTNDKTYLLNIPPMISISTGSECINTSFLTKKTESKEKDLKKQNINQNTIDTKLNLIIS